MTLIVFLLNRYCLDTRYSVSQWDAVVISDDTNAITDGRR